jgi:hypothetical protein
LVCHFRCHRQLLQSHRLYEACIQQDGFLNSMRGACPARRDLCDATTVRKLRIKMCSKHGSHCIAIVEPSKVDAGTDS